MGVERGEGVREVGRRGEHLESSKGGCVTYTVSLQIDATDVNAGVTETSLSFTRKFMPKKRLRWGYLSQHKMKSDRHTANSAGETISKGDGPC